MQPRLFILIFCLSIYTSYSYAENLSGKILHDSHVLTGRGIYTDNSKGEFTKSISRMEVKIERTDEEGFSLFGEIWATYDHLDSNLDQFNDDGNEDADLEELKRADYDELYIREAYISASLGPAEFNIGKMLLNWGRADEINPIDIVNPEDFSEFYLIEKDERKIPILLIDGLLYLGNFTVEVVWIPFFEPARVPTRGPWAVNTFLELRELLTPEEFASLDLSARDDEGKRDIINSETATRLTGHISSFDFGLLFFYGYNDLPALEIGLDSSGLPTAFEVIYRRLHVYGLDFAYALSGYGFRGELVYRDSVLYPKEPSALGLSNHKASDIQSIFGIDKTFGENLYINIQMIYNRLFEYGEAVSADENTLMAMGSVEKKIINDELRIALDLFYGFNRDDWMICPNLEYSLTDNLKAECSFFLFCGPDSSDIGQYDENDAVTFRISYAF